MHDTITQLATIDCLGSSFQIGEAHGFQARDLIGTGLDRWQSAIRARHGDAVEYVRDLLGRTRFLPAIERHTPALLDELRGIAAGAGQPFELMLAYNLMDEEWSFRTGRLIGSAPGCTAVAIAGTAIGQTMDIPSVHDGTQIALRIRPDTGPKKIVFSAAGMLGLNGANQSGIGVVVNNLAQLPASPEGLPVIFVLRRILDHQSASDAASWVESIPHSIGQHYLIGDSTETVSLEAAANGVFRVEVSDRYVHTNHPLVNPDSSADAAKMEANSNTHTRAYRASELVAAATDQLDLESILADREAPISCARKDGFMTFGGTSIGFESPPIVRIAPGPPHETPWNEVSWS